MPAVSYPGDGQRHVEVLAALQPEAPGAGAGQRHGVGAHSSRLLKDPRKQTMAIQPNSLKPHSCWGGEREGRRRGASERTRRKGCETGEGGRTTPEEKLTNEAMHEAKLREKESKKEGAERRKRRTCLFRGAEVSA